MTESKLGNVIISGFSKAIAPLKITNTDLSKMMDTSDDWIRKRSGIETRFWVDEKTKTSTLAIQAAKACLEKLGNPQVDAIVVATLSPDHFFPGVGVQVQHGLGLETIPAYDIRNQCSGFLYGLEMARALIVAGSYRKILLIGAEVHSTGLDKSTRGRDVAVLFGDGAGACLLELETERSDRNKAALRFIDSELHADGSYLKELWNEHPGSGGYPERLTVEMLENASTYPHMNGRLVFEHAVKKMSEVSRSILKKHGRLPEDVLLLVPHQANIRINHMVATSLGIPEDKSFNTIAKYGNTTAATIPIGLTDAEEDHRFEKHGLVLCPAFGSGFTWGAALFEVA
ncbi:MAG: ketoacyl-ACP synthase III [Bdellovibrionota bacterium]